MNSVFFRQLRRCAVFLFVFVATFAWMASPAEAARHGRHAAASRSHHGHASHARRGHARAGRQGPHAKSCYAKVRRHGRMVRVRKPCGESEQVLTNSPIHEQALDESPKTGGKAPGEAVVSGKGRSAVIRAYAVDGTTFFHNGRKIRIEGLGADDNGGLTHELATQKLQRLLDSGSVSVDPVAADDSGATRAVVKVDGKNVADLMKNAR